MNRKVRELRKVGGKEAWRYEGRRGWRWKAGRSSEYRKELGEEQGGNGWGWVYMEGRRAEMGTRKKE